MEVSRHTCISAVLSAMLYAWLRSGWAAAGCFAAGVFIDMDHFLDYSVNFGAKFRPSHFFHSFRDLIFNRIFVLLHAWELAALGWSAVWVTRDSGLLLGLTVGASAHLLLDQVFNKHNPFAYFLLYRLAHRFDAIRFYGAEEYRRRAEIQAEADQDQAAPGTQGY